MKIFVIPSVYPNETNKNAGIYVHELNKALIERGYEIIVLDASAYNYKNWSKSSTKIIMQTHIDEVNVYSYHYRGFMTQTFPKLAIKSYRKKMDVAAELKTREYMARGIPFVYSTQDEVLENATKFCYKVENSESNINIGSIINFANMVRNNCNIINDMRKYAEDNMSWKNQFIKIIRNIGE